MCNFDSTMLGPLFNDTCRYMYMYVTHLQIHACRTPPSACMPHISENMYAGYRGVTSMPCILKYVIYSYVF